MNGREREDQQERWEQAVSDRLSKLRTMPVDMSRLEQAVRAQVPRPVVEQRAAWLRLRPLRAVAASFLVLATLVAVLLLGTLGGPVQASPAHMAKLHEELVSGKLPSVQVDSIEAANKVLAEQWPQSPQLPEVPQEHVMACCMKSVKDKKLACLLMKREGVPVTMTVADAADVRPPDAPKVNRGGVDYYLQSSGKLNMVMAVRQGHWLCLIGELPSERLIEFADQLRF